MLPSLRMGRYVVEGLLGPGGVTETYLARLPEETAADRLFALKLLRRDRVPESVFAEAARRFVAAGQRLRAWQRPGFGRVVDVVDEHDATFIVSEYLPGHDLERLLAMSQAEAQERAGVEPELAALLGAEVARLLQVAHTARPPLPHLGLSPRNVMVCDGGQVVLLDAGIAAAIRPLTEQAPERTWFVAPELRLGAGPGADPIVGDVYALGALLYHLIAGQPPSDGADGMPAGNGPPELPAVTPRVNAVLRALLAPRPEDRPAAGAVVDRLSGGAASVRQRQRRIAEGLRQAEEDARAASARRSDSGPPAEIKVPLPADRMGADARAQVRPGLGRRRDRRKLWVAALFGAAGVAAATVSLLFSTVVGPGHAPAVVPPPSGALGAASRAGGAASERSAAPPSRENIVARLAGHLIAESVPPGATIWVDGVKRGKTFADLAVGPGRHRVVLTLPGHHAFRDVLDTGPGAIVRRQLAVLPPPARGSGLVRVECQTMGRYPILLDDEENGLVCPQLRMPAPVGRHTVGIYLPASGKVESIPVTVEADARPAVARFTQ